MQEDNYLLGYLAHYVSPQGAYYGGLLVTDTRGIPVEFRHSAAVTPTRIQSLLYGDSLELSIGTDALAPELYRALTRKPDILLIDKGSRSLFGTFLVSYPPCALLVALADKDIGSLPDFIALEGISSLYPVELAHKGANNEKIYAYIEDTYSDNKGETVLKRAQSQMNLVSPFNRIRIVLEEISRTEPGRHRK